MTADIRELLKFYAEAGVDDAIEEQPVDRFAEFAARAPAAVAAVERQAQAFASPSKQPPAGARGVIAPEPDPSAGGVGTGRARAGRRFDDQLHLNEI